MYDISIVDPYYREAPHAQLWGGRYLHSVFAAKVDGVLEVMHSLMDWPVDIAIFNHVSVSAGKSLIRPNDINPFQKMKELL